MKREEIRKISRAANTYYNTLMKMDREEASLRISDISIVLRQLFDRTLPRYNKTPISTVFTRAILCHLDNLPKSLPPHREVLRAFFRLKERYDQDFCIYNGDGMVTLRIYLKDIVLSDEDDNTLEIPWLMSEVDLRSCRKVRCEGDMQYYSHEGHPHPNVSTANDICFGGGHNILASAWRLGEIESVVDIIEATLRTYGADEPYCTIANWDGDCGWCHHCGEEVHSHDRETCGFCENLVHSECMGYVSDIDAYYCSSCLEELTVRCDICGDIVRNYTFVRDDTETICETCLREYFVLCRYSHMDIHIDEAVTCFYCNQTVHKDYAIEVLFPDNEVKCACEACVEQFTTEDEDGRIVDASGNSCDICGEAADANSPLTPCQYCGVRCHGSCLSKVLQGEGLSKLACTQCTYDHALQQSNGDYIDKSCRVTLSTGEPVSITIAEPATTTTCEKED